MRYFENPRKFLQQYGLAPSKKLGQNFLINPNTAKRIVSLGGFSPTDHVVEVGVGFGALTSFIAESVARVSGIEIDRGLIRFHEKENDLPANVELIHGDILKSDFKILSEQCGGMLKIIANLPYSISNPFIFKLIENKDYINQVTVMLQKEVAERLTALPGTKAYGIPTVLLGCCAVVEKKLTLKPAEFYPRPKIDSEIISISFVQDNSFIFFREFQIIVRAAFANRRKTLLNNLATIQPLGNLISLGKPGIKEIVSKVITGAGLKPTARAETLTIDEFKALASGFADYLDRNE